MANSIRPRTFTAGATLVANRLVKMSAAETVVYAGVGDEAAVIGVTVNGAANGDPVRVRMLNAGGTCDVESSAAITVNAEVNCAANGRIAANGSETERIGRALAAASGASQAIEVALGYETAG